MAPGLEFALIPSDGAFTPATAVDLTPAFSTFVEEFSSLIAELIRPAPGSNRRVLVILVAVVGSSCRRTGARLLVTAGGERLGSISGACLEEDVLARARRVAATGRAELVTYDTSSENDLVWGVGLGCHDGVHVLLKPISAIPPA